MFEDLQNMPKDVCKMSEIEHAAETLGVKPKELTAFAGVADPFNDNELEGFICRRSDFRYGTLLITHVNGMKKRQLIHATPKFPYPMDKNGVFRFPRAKKIEAYEKLDGTNCFAYSYKDWNGNRFVSYKTRLLPVMQESRFGPFLTYWRELLKRYPDIPKAVLAFKGAGLSYEIYGLRNKHLIIYDTPLDTAILFGVKNDGTLVAPSAINSLPCNAPNMIEASSLEDLASIYKAMQAELEATLVEDATLGGYRGVEGRVWYMLLETGEWQGFKLKPSTIEAIHWAAGGLTRNIVAATAWNVLENYDRCTPERIKELLLEEFNEQEIDIAWMLILRVSAKVNEEAEAREKVFRVYDEMHLDILSDKASTMRALSPHFKKSQMRWVHAVLMAERIR